ADVLASTQASRLAAYEERLQDWSADDLARFAAYLLRYNSAGTSGLPQTPRASAGAPGVPEHVSGTSR
ncbi:hypothetical protein EAO71_19280, partial [Streptomyces sp. ms191]